MVGCAAMFISFSVGVSALPTIHYRCFVQPTLWLHIFIMYISHVSRTSLGVHTIFSLLQLAVLVWKF
jgi:hypothetical protein